MWIPLHESALGHRKFRRLARTLSINEAAAVGHLTLLWLSVLQRAPHGMLDDHDAEDIAAYARWEGDADEFVTALMDVRFLDCIDGTYALHDWDEHTLHGKEKSRRERDKQRKRVVNHTPETSPLPSCDAPHDNQEPQKDTFQHVSSGIPWNSTDDAQTSNGIPSEVSTNDSEFHALYIERDIDKEIEIEKTNTRRAHTREDVLLVFSHYRKFHPHAHPSPQSNSIEWKAIAARMAEGYSVEDLCKAIDGCHRSPFHLGQNESGTKHTGLRIVVRDGSQIANFIAMANNPTPCPTQPVSPATQRLISVGNAWLAKTENALEVH